VEDALIAFDRERATQKLLADAVTTSERAVFIARGQYKAGLTTFLNVLQSENALFQSQDRLAQSDQRLAVDMVALYKALGGGWQTEAVTSAVSLFDSSPKTAHHARKTP
jgi:outer membrane protein TolC